MKQGAPDEFYESSRRNVAVLLVFWLSYIAAYVFVAKFVAVGRLDSTVGVDGFVRRRRSNLRRLMLLGRPKSRPRSLPQSKVLGDQSSFDEVRPPQAASLSEFSDTVSCLSDGLECNSLTPHDSMGSVPEGSMDVAAFFGRHLLSSFSPEFSTAVFGVAVVFQGICLLPATVLALHLLDGSDACTRWEYQWLSMRLLEKWWKWLWASALFLLLCGIPSALLLIEGKEHVDAPGFQKVIILWHRFVAFLGASRLIYALGGIGGASLLYVAAIILGLFEPIQWSFWLTLLNGALFGTSVLLVLIGMPVGLASICRYLFTRYLRPVHSRNTLERMLGELVGQIDEIKNMLESKAASQTGTLKKRPLPVSGGSTPVSSKSLRSKLRQLEIQADVLQSNMLALKSPVWRVLSGLSIYSGAVLFCSVITLVLLDAFLRFTARHLLWYLPGVQLADRIFHRLASAVHLAASSRDGGRVLGTFWRDWLLYSLMYLISMLLLFTGLLRMFYFRRRGHLVSFSLESFTWRMTLERFFLPLMLLLVATVICAPVLSLTGNFDYQLHRTAPYIPLVESVFPLALKRLFDLLHSSLFMRFPVLFWFVLGYRSVLLTLMLAIGLRRMREGGRALRSLWGARSDHLAHYD